MRGSRLLVVVLLLLAGCARGDDTSTTPTTAAPDVMAYFADAGEDAAVAECIAELGRRAFSDEELLAAADGRSIDVETDTQLAELVASCQEAHAVDELIEPELDIQLGDPMKFGDDVVLDQLYMACGNGDGAACDELFDEAPVGSEYEEFGLTCGGRADVLDCAELDRDTVDDTSNDAG